jgi:hypothetical protein
MWKVSGDTIYSTLGPKVEAVAAAEREPREGDPDALPEREACGRARQRK